MDQAEQLRNVIKLHNQNNQNNARVVTITSGKGGVGKSNLAVNLAVCLRKAGKRVIIFDADFGLANVEVMFGAIPQYNLSDFIYRGKSIREIITPGPMDIGFISGGSGIIGLNNLTKEQILYIVNSIDTLNELADFILIDTGAGISDQVLEFVMASPASTSPPTVLSRTSRPSISSACSTAAICGMRCSYLVVLFCAGSSMWPSIWPTMVMQCIVPRDVFAVIEPVSAMAFCSGAAMDGVSSDIDDPS